MMTESLTFKDFNPTKDERVTEIKRRTDELIEFVRQSAGDPSPAKWRRVEKAIDRYEEAAMWAVKSIFS